MTDTTAAGPKTDSEAAGHKPHTVTVTVNGTPVRLLDREVTGREVKQAAQEQGVAIEADFQLSLRHGQRYRVVGDDDTVRARPDAEFLAVAPDDNS